MKKVHLLRLAIFAGLAGVAGSNARASAPADIYGTWLYEKSDCFVDRCQRPADAEKAVYGSKPVVILTDRYANPMDGGVSVCRTGVDVSSIKNQDSIELLKNQPVEVTTQARRIPKGLGLSHQPVPAGIITCNSGGGNLVTVILPAKDRLLLIQEGGVLISFRRASP